MIKNPDFPILSTIIWILDFLFRAKLLRGPWDPMGPMGFMGAPMGPNGSPMGLLGSPLGVPFIPPQLRDSNFGCVGGGDWEVPVRGWSFPRTRPPPARPPAHLDCVCPTQRLCVSHRDSVCVPHRHCVSSTQTLSLSHTDIVSVPHRHCLCSTQTMSLFHTDNVTVPQRQNPGRPRMHWLRRIVV